MFAADVTRRSYVALSNAAETSVNQIKISNKCFIHRPAEDMVGNGYWHCFRGCLDLVFREAG
jgi:hypothetical protein